MFVTVLWFHIVTGAELIIKPVGEKQSQPAGKGFVLTCEGTAKDTNLFTDMKWIDPKDETIDKGSHKQIEVWEYENQLALIFKNPVYEQSGRYKCIALYSNADRLNASVDIIFYKDITWEECRQEQALIINEDGKIRCQVSANPSASITWYKDSKPIEDDRYETVTDGISVKNVVEEDEGIYTMRAMVTQTGRFQTKSISVKVHVPPKIVQLENTVEVTEGEEAALTCQATGSPQPEYTWLDPKKQDLSSVEGYFVGKDTGILTIRSVKKDDSGKYTCEARNNAGEDSGTLTLTVVVKPEIRQFDNITVVENKDAILECQAFGEPLPKLSIRKDGNEEPFGEDNDRVHLSPREESGMVILTMVINRSIRSDDGLYYCSATNKGAHVERVGHITIEFAPIMSATPVTQAKTWNDNPVNLTCIAEAIPNATIIWWHKGQEIKEGNPLYVQYGKSSYSNLLVKPSRHLTGGENVYGPYKCEASNAHGKKEITIELNEARVPAALLQTRVLKKTATTVTFMLVGPRDNGGMAIRAYVVEFRKKDEPPDASVQREWSEDTPYILDNLKPRVAYRFKFAARNDVGIGEWTEEIEEVMPPESYPESPRFITPGGNISRYPDRFEVRWTVPQDNGRPIDYFQIRYFQVIKDGNDWKMVGKPTEEVIKDWQNAPRFELTSLNSNSYYKVEVRAHNEIGFSQDATMIFQTATGSGVADNSVSDKEEDEINLSMAAIITIVVVLVVIILVAVDVTCFLRYQWGLLYFFRTSLCGKSAAGDKAKEAAAEDGKGSKEKEPLQLQKEDRRDKVYAVNEDTPMIETVGAKDTKTETNSVDAEIKNKSPKGSKSSIAKDSLV